MLFTRFLPYDIVGDNASNNILKNKVLKSAACGKKLVFYSDYGDGIFW